MMRQYTTIRAGVIATNCSIIAAISLVLVVLPGGGNAAPGQQSDKQTQSGAPPAPAANEKAAKPGTRGSSSVLVLRDEDYRIGPNDVLDIQIESWPEMTRSFRVTAAGTFLMPYLGRVVAAEKTPEELAKFIADGLRGDYLRDPKVTVSVKEYNSRSFYIQGSVRNAGVYQIEGRPSLLELLTLAGGLLENHGSRAYIIHRIKYPAQEPAGQETASPKPSEAGTTSSSDQNQQTTERPKYELSSANISGLLKGRFDQDVLIEPGDFVNIPATDIFFVSGEVKAPGSFPLKEGTTLQQAVSLAQGTLFKSAADKTIIFRENSDGQREVIRVDLSAVMKGKKPDVPIMANDIIMVPSSKMKSIGGAMLSAFGMTTVTRIPIY
jgi:polysaccharide biosynthesis/export protein